MIGLENNVSGHSPVFRVRHGLFYINKPVGGPAVNKACTTDQNCVMLFQYLSISGNKPSRISQISQETVTDRL